MYFHGSDGEIGEWKDISVEKRRKILALLKNLQDLKIKLIKLDYRTKYTNMSDEVWIGPISSCNQYTEAKKLISKSGLDFISICWHHESGTATPLSTCLDESSFD